MFPTHISKLTFTGRTNLRSTRIIRTTWRKRRARRTDVARTRLSFPCSVESDNFMQSDSKNTNAVTISVVKSKVNSFLWKVFKFWTHPKLRKNAEQIWVDQHSLWIDHDSRTTINAGYTLPYIALNHINWNISHFLEKSPITLSGDILY